MFALRESGRGKGRKWQADWPEIILVDDVDDDDDDPFVVSIFASVYF